MNFSSTTEGSGGLRLKLSLRKTWRILNVSFSNHNVSLTHCLILYLFKVHWKKEINFRKNHKNSLKKIPLVVSALYLCNRCLIEFEHFVSKAGIHGPDRSVCADQLLGPCIPDLNYNCTILCFAWKIFRLIIANRKI